MTFCRSWMLKAMPKRNLGQKELCPILTQEDSRLGDGVWCEVSLFPPTCTHLHIYPSLQYISLHLPRNLKAWNFTLVATTSCKNVETLPRKNDLFCFKSLLVAGLWDIILTSLLPPIQSCSSIRGRGTSQAQDHGQAVYAKIQYSVSSTFATGCSLHLGSS